MIDNCQTNARKQSQIRLNERKPKNTHGRLDSQKHLDALGLECKIERNRKTTKGWRLQSVKLDSSALKQPKKQDQNNKSVPESIEHSKP